MCYKQNRHTKLKNELINLFILIFIKKKERIRPFRRGNKEKEVTSVKKRELSEQSEFSRFSLFRTFFDSQEQT